jgi:hypothetical protein
MPSSFTLNAFIAHGYATFELREGPMRFTDSTRGLPLTPRRTVWQAQASRRSAQMFASCGRTRVVSAKRNMVPLDPLPWANS